MLLSLLGLLMAADLPEPAKLPASKTYPDPLVMRDGTKIKTADDWTKKRAPELKQLFQHYMYGQMPATPKVTAKVERTDEKALDGKATLKEISLTIGPEKAPKIHLLLVVPNKRKTPAPCFVGLNFCGNHALLDDPAIRIPTSWIYANYPGVVKNKATAKGRGKQSHIWNVADIIDRGYALATFYSGDVDPDQTTVREGIRPYLDKKLDSGTIAVWAWALSRAVDYLLTNKDIDGKKIIAVGHSRLGKTALVAGAFDERIALTIPHQAGCGGTAPNRTMGAEKVETVKRINTSFPHWFNGQFKKFNDDVDRLPFDQHCLAALVAPRPLLYTNAKLDQWANPAGQFEMLKLADPVYRLLGSTGLKTKTMPKLGELSDGKLGYFIREGKHEMNKADWKVFMDYADKHLGKPGSKSAKKSVLFIGQGPDGHPARTHEYMPGLKVLATTLGASKGLTITTVQVDDAWKNGPELIDRADGVVLFLAEGAKWMSQDAGRYRALERLMKRGGGLVVLQWAMGTRDEGPIEKCLALLGGCHGGKDRKYKVVDTVLTLGDKKHPIARGLDEIKIKDEFYYALKFVKPDKGLTPILRTKIDGAEHTVAWAFERPKGGRAFGFSGLHFHASWKQESYRRLVAQGVLWTLGQAIPVKGLSVEREQGQTPGKGGRRGKVTSDSR